MITLNIQNKSLLTEFGVHGPRSNLFDRCLTFHGSAQFNHDPTNDLPSVYYLIQRVRVCSTDGGCLQMILCLVQRRPSQTMPEFEWAGMITY